MPNNPLTHIKKCGLTRREFMWLSSMAAAGYVFGCATDPVTGKSQLMLVSEDTEIQIDRQYSPLQFSSDFGEVQDSKLNRYVSQVGNKMTASSHRPHMPYSFRVVNATYINAYAFPGGSIAATRGIMLSLDNEAELASLLGHELGHVNARHSAEQMSKGQLTQAVVGGISVLAGTQSAALATWPASWARLEPVHCWHLTAGITNAKQMPWAWNIWWVPDMGPKALSG
jgi:predicted Zn-dependent protease